MDEKIARILNWAKGKEMPPFTLDISPTDKCNLRCIHCWQRAYEKIDSSYELSNEQLVKVVKDAIKLGVEEFEITGGGEPFLRKKLVLKLMEMIKKNGKFGNITTNGTLFSEEDVKEIVKIGWDRITFSLDGPDEKTNDFIRGEGTFEKVINSIEFFNRIKGLTKRKFPILKFNVVVNKKNYKKVVQMIELAKKLKCSIVHFDSLTIHSKMGKKLKLSKREEEEFENLARRAKKLAEGWGIWTDVSFLKSNFLEKSNQMEEILLKESDSKDFSSLICYEPWWHLVIKTNGTAQPCCLYDEKEENVKNSSLKKIWFGSFFEKIRNDMKDGKLSNYCSICNAGQVFENRRIRMELKRWTKK